MEEETEVKKLRSSPSNGTDESTNQEEKKEENVLKFLDSGQNVLKFLDSGQNVLKFLDSMNDYLILMDSLSSKLRQGFFELASARYSMGSSRISSALFDLKYHHTATSMEMNQLDAGSDVKQPHFTLHKWASTDNEELGSKFEEDELLHQKSSSPHGNQVASLSSEIQEKRSENNGSEGTVGSPCAVDNHVQKERAKALSMFGVLVSPKLRAAQLSFETVLETIEEIANVRSSMLCAYDQAKKEMESSKG